MYVLGLDTRITTVSVSMKVSVRIHIEDGYEAGAVTGVVFVDLSAVYDTVNIRRLLWKVSKLTHDRKFVGILGELLHNRRFQVHLQSGQSRWRKLRNGLPQGSVLAPTLFNIYTNDQPQPPNTTSFIYADDLALAAQAKSFEVVETYLSAALEDLDIYYRENALKPNPAKTQSCAYHLRNRMANRKLDVVWRGVRITHTDCPKYLGITLDRSLTYKTNCENVKKKVFSRNNLLRRLTTSKSGAAPNVLRITGLALCFSAGEYACPVWGRSTHSKGVDVALNETCRIITGCLKPTPVQMLYPLAGIAPPAVRRNVAASLEKMRQETDHRHPLHGARPPRSRLKSRNSFLASVAPVKDAPKTRIEQWEELALPDFLPPVERLPPGYDQPWPVWKYLNRLRAQVGRCRENLCKWGDTDDNSCGCGAIPQTMRHLLCCPLCPDSCIVENLYNATDNAVCVAKYWASKI
ncbi:hypothetical protein B5X24_HaOG212107 [Helicoverpa armigera]|uniref:Reverse transcriptase domain-containing protein n=1 Tax=Helicoverpa armigera TaxID=29058 RepID=A0A2W1BC05_HELAM|nr:hypothetical protein B5X24_HaOG212107 [Helicoverpa armigera]